MMMTTSEQTSSASALAKPAAAATATATATAAATAALPAKPTPARRGPKTIAGSAAAATTAQHLNIAQQLFTPDATWVLTRAAVTTPERAAVRAAYMAEILADAGPKGGAAVAGKLGEEDYDVYTVSGKDVVFSTTFGLSPKQLAEGKVFVPTRTMLGSAAWTKNKYAANYSKPVGRGKTKWHNIHDNYMSAHPTALFPSCLWDDTAFGVVVTSGAGGAKRAADRSAEEHHADTLGAKSRHSNGPTGDAIDAQAPAIAALNVPMPTIDDSIPLLWAAEDAALVLALACSSSNGADATGTSSFLRYNHALDTLVHTMRTTSAPRAAAAAAAAASTPASRPLAAAAGVLKAAPAAQAASPQRAVVFKQPQPIVASSSSSEPVPTTSAPAPAPWAGEIVAVDFPSQAMRMCVNAARVKNTRPIEQLLEPVKLAHPTLFSGITLADRQRYKESSLYTTYVLPLTTLFYMQYGLALERRIAAAEHRSDGKSVLAIPADPQGWLEQGVRHVLNASNSGERTWRALHAEVDKVRAAHPDIFAPVEAPGSKIRTFKPFVDILLPVAYEVYRRMLAPLRERCLALGVSDALIEQ